MRKNCPFYKGCDFTNRIRVLHQKTCVTVVWVKFVVVSTDSTLVFVLLIISFVMVSVRTSHSCMFN